MLLVFVLSSKGVWECIEGRYSGEVDKSINTRDENLDKPMRLTRAVGRGELIFVLVINESLGVE